MGAKKRVFFRCDATVEIGGGHLVRCLAMAEQAKERGWSCHFLSRDLPEVWVAQIRDEGHILHALRGDSGSDEETAMLTDIFAAHPSTLLVVDHYALSEEWEAPYFPQVPILVVDDLCNRRHLCHALLDSNFRLSPNPYVDLVPSFTEIFLGPKYVPMRRQFHNLSVQDFTHREGLLIFFGSGDPGGHTLHFLEACRQSGVPWPCRVVVSRANAAFAKMTEQQWPSTVQVLIQPENIAELMLKSRLFFGSGGTITWERMRCGLPGLIVSVAENQVPASKDLKTAGYQEYLGPLADLKYDFIFEKINRLYGDTKRLVEFSSRGCGLVEPLDAEALFEEVLKRGLAA